MASDSSSDTEVISLALYDELGELLIDFAKDDTSGRISLGIMEFVESISETSMRGVVSVDTTKGEFDQLQLSGNESLQFKLKTPSDADDSEDIIMTSPMFRVYDFDNSSDNTDLTLLPEGIHGKIVTLKFSSKQESSVFDNNSPLQYGFLGKIANTQIINQGEYAEDIYAFESDGEFDIDQIDDSDLPPLCPGLINELALRYFPGEAFDIEGTDNTILLSPKRFTFPNKKITKNMNLLQLINHATKYAWKKSNIIESENDTGAAFSEYGWSNYFFWQDLNGWHFKSATKMASDGKAKDIKTFSFSQDVLNPSRIRKLDVISDFSISKAFSDGMLYSYYTRIEPDYDDLYSRFLSDESKYNETRYEYNYGSDYNPIVESNRLLPDTVFDPINGTEMDLPTWIRERKNDELKIDDRLFGHYTDRQYGDKKELYRLIGRGFDVDSPSYDGRLENLDYNPELSDYNLYQDGMWQEMFDCVDVMGSADPGPSGDNALDDCSVLRKIKKIKADTFINKALYRRALEYKEKWNVYRYSVCCDGTKEVKNDFFAIIKGHKKIGDNIYRYSWAEVAMIPKAELGFVVGFGFTANAETEGPTSDSAIYNSDVFSRFSSPAQADGLNAFYMLDPDQKILWTPHIDPETSYVRQPRFGYFSGTIWFHPQFYDDPFYDGVTGSISWDYVKHLFKGVSAEGLTLTFHNSQHSPFLVIEKENAIRGSTGNYSGAYNLNEIMNRKLLNESTYPSSGYTGPNSTIYFQTSDIDNSPPGNVYANQQFTEPTFDQEHLIGPGINANDEKTEYPSSFDMMPIGGYKPLGSPPELECEAVAYGHIVRMSSVSYEDVLKVGIEPRNYPIEARDKRFFYFSAENAHDGNCSGECAL